MVLNTVYRMLQIEKQNQKQPNTLTTKFIKLRKIFFLLAAILTISFASTAQTTADSLKRITIKVSNLHCINDMPTIKKQLLNQDGIEEVTFTDINASISVFTINYHTSAISQEQIEKAIESTPGCDDKSEMPYRVKRDHSRKNRKS